MPDGKYVTPARGVNYFCPFCGTAIGGTAYLELFTRIAVCTSDRCTACAQAWSASILAPQMVTLQEQGRKDAYRELAEDRDQT